MTIYNWNTSKNLQRIKDKQIHFSLKFACIHWDLVIGTSSVIETPSSRFVIGTYSLSERSDNETVLFIRTICCSDNETVLIIGIRITSTAGRTRYRNSDNEYSRPYSLSEFR